MRAAAEAFLRNFDDLPSIDFHHQFRLASVGQYETRILIHIFFGGSGVSRAQQRLQRLVAARSSCIVCR